MNMSIEAWRKCVGETLTKHIIHSLTGNIPAIINNIKVRQKCNALLTDEEREQLLRENKGWYDLFKEGGPLDPTRPGYMNRI
jgi:hypothetical protein